ncbi:type II toxin-antitoxin system VapC family toxin [Nocardioides sp. LHD-245]|uniref:type II toxin-antitoxin system VapC family toxin n=1 Tax=Nocardioides sp. LHD-245 TaxID=3051387 RepID=UPI0027E0B2C5|nr:type II toxin-antitoxin system VapC family toxin [Nocardioides sp. LHD-245]
MARLIALDANVLIAVTDERDSHHQAAKSLLAEHLDRELVIGSVNLAEVLVGPARVGRVEQTLMHLSRVGVTELPLPGGAAPRLAVLRASTGLKMPDCCVLLTAQHARAAVATFDRRLRAAARSLGLAVLPDDDDPDPRS